jgi:hypothetical protein
MMASHRLPVSAQAHANAVRVMPEPKPTIDARENRMTGSPVHKPLLSVQANAHEARVTPEPKQAADARPDSMKASHDNHFGNRA